MNGKETASQNSKQKSGLPFQQTKKKSFDEEYGDDDDIINCNNLDKMTSRAGTKTVIDIEAGGGGDGGGGLEESEAATVKKSAIVPCVYFDLGGLSTFWQFAILSGSVMFFYLLYGITMEHIFRLPGLKKEGFYLTFVQFIFYTGMAKLEMLRTRDTRHIPIKTYFLLAAATFTTMGLSNASLGYLNYPTQVVFKCCKLIPVLLGGIFIQRKTYGMLDFYAAAMMSIGLALFILADSKVSPNFDFTGVIMLSVALVADAVVGNVQEKAMKAHKASNPEVILYSYGIGTLYLAVYLLFSGNLVSGFSAFAQDPVNSYGHAFIFSLTGYFGALVVLSLVRTFGAFAAVTVTSMRKALSIVISFVLFSKPFTTQYFVGGLVVLLGIYLNLASKTKMDFSSMLTNISNLTTHLKNFCLKSNSRPKLATQTV